MISEKLWLYYTFQFLLRLAGLANILVVPVTVVCWWIGIFSSWAALITLLLYFLTQLPGYLIWIDRKYAEHVKYVHDFETAYGSYRCIHGNFLPTNPCRTCIGIVQHEARMHHAEQQQATVH